MASPARPFYSEYAWAYDLLIDRPVRKECGGIAGWLIERGVFPGATLLDAGCGTGRYALELARRGYVVEGIDASPELIAEATRALAGAPMAVTFTVGDVAALPPYEYDAILCRGVLNDLLEDAARERVLSEFGRHLRPAGVLVLDVRDWEATAERRAREPLFRKSVDTSRGKLTFTSVTEIDPEGRRLIVRERHTLEAAGVERASDSEFVMRCWTREELAARLRRAGFDDVAYFGAYDPAIDAGATDRLVAVAQLLPAAA